MLDIRFAAILIGLGAFCVAPPPLEATVKPPAAKKIPHTEVVFGDTRIDDYYWLREKDSPDVLAHLRAENAYAEQVMEPTKALQETLYAELLGRLKETDAEVPYREGDAFYYNRTEKGKQYKIYCRRRESLDAPEEITLDLNALAEGKAFLGIGDYEVSDDGNWLAYSADTTGFREYTLHVKDLRTGKLGPEQIERVSWVVWAADNKTLFYASDDATKRPYRVYRHQLGSSDDELLYEEEDERFGIALYRSLSGAYVFMATESHTTSEVYYLPAAEPASAFRLIAPREQDHEYEVAHRGDDFIIRTNSGGRNFRLVSAPVSDPRRANWTEILPHREDVMLDDFETFAGHTVVLEREAGVAQLLIIDAHGGGSHRIEFPEPIYGVDFGDNQVFDTDLLRFEYESLTTPESVYDYNMKSRERELLKREEVLGGYDPSRYRTERIFAVADDGVRVPISLVYLQGAQRDGSSPAHLYGYGSYGVSIPPRFSSSRISLLDRGVIFAIAHVRGGGEMGQAWHDAGRMKAKMNTFTDFIAAARHLIDEKYTSSERLLIEGRSAGGLLMGAVANMRPDLFKAVVATVPFVDVINTMRDETLPLTVAEFEEWGNPRVEDDYRYMKRYCPYTNIAPRAYPALLVQTSYEDSQVMYWEPAKYVAKLRALKTDANPVIFKINMAGGHGGSSGRYDKLRETAYEYAFVLTQLGIDR